MIAYFCISAGAVKRMAAPGKVRRNAPDTIPVSVIGRFAVAGTMRAKDSAPTSSQTRFAASRSPRRASASGRCWCTPRTMRRSVLLHEVRGVHGVPARQSHAVFSHRNRGRGLQLDLGRRLFDPTRSPRYHTLNPAISSSHMSHNTFGHLFRVTTFGESHGAALGCVVDGCPSRCRSKPQTSRNSRSAPSRPVALHHAAPGARRGKNSVRRDDGRDRRQVTHGNADRAADREYRPALQGLRRDQGSLPARPRRLRL